VLRVPCSPSRMRVQMAKVLTPEESARSILAVFQASGARANEVLMLGTVDRIFLNRRDARPSDFTFGLHMRSTWGGSNSPVRVDSSG
jgi:hypothetical protein